MRLKYLIIYIFKMSLKLYSKVYLKQLPKYIALGPSEISFKSRLELPKESMMCRCLMSRFWSQVHSLLLTVLDLKFWMLVVFCALFLLNILHHFASDTLSALEVHRKRSCNYLKLPPSWTNKRYDKYQKTLHEKF